jgi:hypothetical protein
VVVFVALVSGALLTDGLVQFAFSYRENQTALLDLQREKAAGAAVRIAQFVKEIEHQLAGAIPAQPGGSAVAPAQLRSDYEWLLHQAPAITEVAYLDASGREQLRVSRVAMSVGGAGPTTPATRSLWRQPTGGPTSARSTSASGPSRI